MLGFNATTEMAEEDVGYNAESIGNLTNRQRCIFFALFLLIYLGAVTGNVLAVFTTYSRKHRYIQKALIISLALSDLIMGTAYAMQYLNTFAHSLLKWIFGLTSGAGAIIIIAVDRYRSAVNVTMKRWNPKLWLCLLLISLLWCVATGIAYPTQILYEYKKILIVMEDEDGLISQVHNYVCIHSSRNNLMLYYISITLIIFSPLLITAIWLYFHIYKLIYKHNATRKISDSQMYRERINTEGVPEEGADRRRKARPQRRSIHMGRKIRTFKIMIFLILIFLLLRSPHWIYASVVLSYEHMDRQEWIVNFALSSIALLSCAMNPYLYSFLPETIARMEKMYKAISQFTCEVCCCCCSNAEFEQFEKENPFSVENYDRQYNQRTGTKSSKNQKVKFEDVVTTQHGKIERF